MNLGDLYCHVDATLDGDLPVIIEESAAGTTRTITARDMARATNNLASAMLQLGARPGDKLAIYTRNRAEYLQALVAGFKARLVHVNVNYRYESSELRYLLNNSDARFVVFESEYAARLDAIRGELPKAQHFLQIRDGAEPLLDGALDFATLCDSGAGQPPDIERSPQDLFFLYTGGTTGMPKAAMWEQYMLWRMIGRDLMRMDVQPARSVAEFTLNPRGHSHATLIILPLMHGAGVYSGINALAHGSCCVLPRSPTFDPDLALRCIDKHPVGMMSIAGDSFARPLLDAVSASRGAGNSGSSISGLNPGGADDSGHDLNGLNPGGADNRGHDLSGLNSSGAYDLSGLQVVTSTATVFSPALKRAWLEAFPNATILDTVGSSESSASAMAVINRDSYLGNSSGSAPDTSPDNASGNFSSNAPDNAPGNFPNNAPNNAPDLSSDSTPDNAPGNAPDLSPNSTPDITPGNSLAKDIETNSVRMALTPSAKVFTEDLREVVPGSGETGFLAVSGVLPLGYYKDEKKTAETFITVDGVRYSRPGDWVELLADNTLKFLGRGNACINSGGEKIYPEEVETALKTHPQVLDCLVVGVPDERWGQAVTAVVSIRNGAAPTADALRDHVRAKLAGFKVPKNVLFVDEVFRAPNGKADYPATREYAVRAMGLG